MARTAVYITRGDDLLEAAVDSARSAIQRVSTVAPELAAQPAPEGFILTQVFPAGRTPDGNGWIVRAQITTASADARAQASDPSSRD